MGSLDWGAVCRGLDASQLPPLFLAAAQPGGRRFSYASFEGVARGIIGKAGVEVGPAAVGMAVDRLFTVLDREGSGTVDWRYCLLALLALSKGGAHSKLGMALIAYDERGDGQLLPHELYDLACGVYPGSDRNDICRVVDEEFRKRDIPFETAVGIAEVASWALMNSIADGMQRLGQELSAALTGPARPDVNLGRGLAGLEVNRLKQIGKQSQKEKKGQKKSKIQGIQKQQFGSVYH